MDRGEGFDDGDFGDEGRGMGTRFSNIVGAEVGAGGGEGGWMVRGSLYCISIFMLKRTESLKDLSKDSKVFLINKFVSMRSTRNHFSIVSSRLAY